MILPFQTEKDASHISMTHAFLHNLLFYFCEAFVNARKHEYLHMIQNVLWKVQRITWTFLQFPGFPPSSAPDNHPSG